MFKKYLIIFFAVFAFIEAAQCMSVKEHFSGELQDTKKKLISFVELDFGPERLDLVGITTNGAPEHYLFFWLKEHKKFHSVKASPQYSGCTKVIKIEQKKSVHVAILCSKKIFGISITPAAINYWDEINESTDASPEISFDPENRQLLFKNSDGFSNRSFDLKKYWPEDNYSAYHKDPNQ